MIVWWFPSSVTRNVAALVAMLAILLSTAHWLNIETIVLVSTFVMACFGFWRTYKVVALIRESRKPASPANPNGASRFDLPFPILWEQILIPFTLVAFGVSWLFARPGRPFFTFPVPYLDKMFNPASWGNSAFVPASLWGAGWFNASADVRRDRLLGPAPRLEAV